jgi:hypothetical protein
MKFNRSWWDIDKDVEDEMQDQDKEYKVDKEKISLKVIFLKCYKCKRVLQLEIPSEGLGFDVALECPYCGEPVPYYAFDKYDLPHSREL